MKCSRCLRTAEAIMCSSCYAQNCTHNEEGRRAVVRRHQETVRSLDALLPLSRHLDNALTLTNRAAAIIHSQTASDSLLQTTHHHLHRTKKENQMLKEKIAERRAFVARLELEAKSVGERKAEKLRQRALLAEKADAINREARETLDGKFKGLMRFMNGNFNFSRQAWEKFVNMEEELVSVYVALMENELDNEIVSEIWRAHEQIRKQMVAVAVLGSLMQVALPYPLDLRGLVRPAAAVLFQQTSEGSTLNRQLLRHLQANAHYLFSRFGLEMEYPHIDSQALSSILREFSGRRLGVEADFDYTQPVYVPSLEAAEAVLSWSLSDSTGEGGLLELSVEGLLRGRKDKGSAKLVLEESTTEEIQFTEIIELGRLQSKDSDDEVEILQ